MPLTRRQFLSGAVGAGAAGVAGLTLAQHSWLRDDGQSRRVTAEALDGDGILVLLTLYGGNDGLGTVIPWQDPTFLDRRGELGRFEEVLPLGEGFALHPELDGLKGLWDRRQLAIVNGVGYPEPNRSHFVSMGIWQSGDPVSDQATGWLGRWLDGDGKPDPLKAIGVGTTLAPALRGEKVSGAAVPVGEFSVPGSPGLVEAFATMQGASPDHAWLEAQVARNGTDLLTATRAIAGVLDGADDDDAAGSTSLEGGDDDGARRRPGGELGAQLDLVANLIEADLPTRVYGVSMGGFDTHSGQVATHTRLMGDLDAAVDGFFRGIQGSQRADDVVLLAYSEFGRRVAANASDGTDHGAAGIAFVAGPKVKGGFYGDPPSLTDLDQGDLKHTVDFRSLYATVLGGVLGADATASFDKPWKPLPLL